MTTTLEPQFLRICLAMSDFKPGSMLETKGALLILGLRYPEFTAADLPQGYGGTHLSGAATGALVAEGLLEVCGRIKSPKPNAKGRKLDVLRLVSVELAKTWLRANRIDPDLDKTPAQPDLFQSDVRGSTFEVHHSSFILHPSPQILLPCS